MKWRKWLESWNMSGLKFSAGFLEMQWSPQSADRDAAWRLYIEMLTRITTQPLIDDSGDEKSALESLVSLFATTRAIIHEHGRDCMEFTKLAIVVLNQIVRPFTAKWHRIASKDDLSNSEVSRQFRNELAELQTTLRTYTQMLGQMAGIEQDLTELEISD